MDLLILIMFLFAGLRLVKDVCFINDVLIVYNLNGIKVYLIVCGFFFDLVYVKCVWC